MKTYPKTLRALFAAAALVPAVASADLAVTTGAVNMRAGPDTSYPQVVTLGRGAQVDVIGCVEGWQWCDVVAGPNRGWVFAQYLSYNYYNRPTVISYGGPTLGIPLISFAIGPYWDNYYRGRPWYGNRHYWYSRPVARAPEWHAPPNWHANSPVYRGNDWHGDNRGHGDNRSHSDNRGHDDNRGNNNRGNNSSDRPQYGGHYSANSGPDPRPHINDQAHPNAQQ